MIFCDIISTIKICLGVSDQVKLKLTNLARDVYVGCEKKRQSSACSTAYHKVPKFSDARNLCCNLPKIQTKRPNPRVFCPDGANGIANSEDPDQTAPLGAVWSGSALFALAYLSENLGSLR